MPLAGWFGHRTGRSFEISRALASELGERPRRIHRWRSDDVEFGCTSHDCINERASNAVVVDGCIDNHADLARELGCEDPHPTKAELLLIAWERWDEDFLDHVHGEIACALWDGRRRRLILGRDALGWQPLHYSGRNGHWMFSSTAGGLLTDPDIAYEPDEIFLAETLTQLDSESGRSPYREISRVPPGCLAIIEGGNVRIHRYWRPERIAPLQLRRRQDYADALRAGLEQAVRCRLPGTGLVGSELSSGLDSTTVTCLAARELAAQGRQLVAYTSVPTDPVDESRYPGRIVDEGPLAALVAAQYPNVEHVRVPTRGRGGLFAMVDRHSLATREMETPSPNGLWADAIGEDARRRGIGVLLTGGFGNVTASYHGLPRLVTLAREFDLLGLAGAWQGLRRWDRASWPWSRLAWHSFAPLLPRAVVARIRRTTGRYLTNPIATYGINPDFAQKTGVADRMTELSAGNMAHDGISWRLSMMGDLGHSAAVPLLHGVHARDPMGDRRLLELCLSIPEEQFLYRGEPRALIRAAMAGIVPDEILYERRSGLQSADWPQRFTEARSEFVAEMARLEASPLAQRALDLPRLRRLVDDWPSSPEAWHGKVARDNALITLVQAFGAGRFLRQFETTNQ